MEYTSNLLTYITRNSSDNKHFSIHFLHTEGQLKQFTNHKRDYFHRYLDFELFDTSTLQLFTNRKNIITEFNIFYKVSIEKLQKC